MIRELIVTGVFAALLVIYLLAERLILNKKVRRIPLRICVTGTRGKSSITRLIAASLREAGFAVLARTTGSKPVVILPDGEEEEIRRRGSPSILEGNRREGGPIAYDLTGNGKLELIVVQSDSIFVYDSNGEVLDEFPAYIEPSHWISSSPAVGDVNGDGLPEIVISASERGTTRVTLYVFTHTGVILSHIWPLVTPLKNYYVYPFSRQRLTGPLRQFLILRGWL